MGVMKRLTKVTAFGHNLVFKYKVANPSSTSGKN